MGAGGLQASGNLRASASLKASGYRVSRYHRASGYTLLELLFASALIAILSAIAVPQSLAGVDRARAASAARYLASRMAVARSQAVLRSTHVALRFEGESPRITFRTFADGNRNGVLTADITAGIDVPLDAAILLGDLYSGVAIAVAGEAGSGPVRLGSSNLLSFTPLGTATSGSVFVRGRDGSQYAIRVLGATGRTRVQRFVVHSRTWIDAF
jgi:prepilin-type N-terminal cleavage/methylation domain-containing protein